MKAEIYKPRNAKDGQETTGSYERGMELTFSYSKGTKTAGTLILDF